MSVAGDGAVRGTNPRMGIHGAPRIARESPRIARESPRITRICAERGAWNRLSPDRRNAEAWKMGDMFGDGGHNYFDWVKVRNIQFALLSEVLRLGQ